MQIVISVLDDKGNKAHRDLVISGIKDRIDARNTARTAWEEAIDCLASSPDVTEVTVK